MRFGALAIGVTMLPIHVLELATFPSK